MPGVREMLAGRYELREVLGRGGMGVVFCARDSVLDRLVAVKVLPPERSDDETFVARFEREARAAAALAHPNIAAVFDTGRDGTTRFIVMEFVRGSTLAALLRREGRLPPPRALEIGAEIAGALDAAHGAGIIHRDVKPANVMVDDRGGVKVLDFGIARAAGDTSLTQAAMVLGSAPYLAPEVARGERADERSDIYSLGCVIYEMLTGRPPFAGEVPEAVLHQHASAPPRPPRELNAQIPPGMEALVLQMLAKSPGARPQHAGDAAQALLSPGDRPAGGIQGANPPAVPGTAPTRVLRRTRVSPSRRTVLGAILAGIVAVAVVLLLLGSSSSPKHRAGDAHSNTAHTAAARTHTLTSTQSTSAAPPTNTAPTTGTAPPTQSAPTVPTAAAELTRLATGDVAAGTIDQQASQQILSRLQDILNNLGKGNPNDTVHKLTDFSKQITQLAQHGDIQPTALSGITGAINDLRAALASAAPAQTNQTPPQPNHPKPPHH